MPNTNMQQQHRDPLSSSFLLLEIDPYSLKEGIVSFLCASSAEKYSL